MAIPNETAWPDFQQQWARSFRQGQHVTVIGPTGCGKTTLVSELQKVRRYVVAFGVKHRDSTMDELIRDHDFVRISDWKKRRKDQRIALWPKVTDISQVESVHRRVFGHALADIYKVGGWTLWLDEMRYLADHLSMRKPLTQMYVLGRSNNISIIGNAQRPSWIPLEAYSQAGHLILFKTGDERDLERIGSLNGANAKEVARTVSELPYRHFLHVDLINRSMTISKLQK